MEMVASHAVIHWRRTFAIAAYWRSKRKETGETAAMKRRRFAHKWDPNLLKVPRVTGGDYLTVCQVLPSSFQTSGSTSPLLKDLFTPFLGPV
ncbi:hypothetical protein L484_000125 [Morus notabilis]|uniref:Uncharacterized protein n=1 Tax=Morus notabilis TaxID=981085 RepID=W9S285_9ROSA|nr:hypothetical protein L484_001339 [Morus notabilis]EXC66679.1 hypothetical protein L484_000125 [Morus notabilis]